MPRGCRNGGWGSINRSAREGLSRSKVYPWNAGGQKAINACEASYAVSILIISISTYYTGLAVCSRRDCRSDGKIDRPGQNPPWGVSNLDYADMQELWQLPGGISVPLIRCFTISVHEGLSTTTSLVPETADAGDGLQSVSPAGRLRNGLLKNAVVNEIAHATISARHKYCWRG